MENWKDIPGYEGLYKASTEGNIMSMASGIKLSNKRNGGNYIIVTLSKNGTKKSYLAHRLIALTFIPNPHNLPLVNHINENKQDNRVDNLEWSSVSYNLAYGSRPHQQAEKCGKRVLCVETGETFLSLGLAGASVNRPYQNISRACRNPSKTCGGYHWRFV